VMIFAPAGFVGSVRLRWLTYRAKKRMTAARASSGG